MQRFSPEPREASTDLFIRFTEQPQIVVSNVVSRCDALLEAHTYNWGIIHLYRIHIHGEDLQTVTFISV